MNYKIIFKIAFYLGIISSVILLWLSVDLSVKYGLDHSLATDPVLTGERISYSTKLYLIIISISTFGLIILEFFRNKKKNAN